MRILSTSLHSSMIILFAAGSGFPDFKDTSSIHESRNEEYDHYSAVSDSD